MLLVYPIAFLGIMHEMENIFDGQILVYLTFSFDNDLIQFNFKFNLLFYSWVMGSLVTFLEVAFDF